MNDNFEVDFNRLGFFSDEEEEHKNQINVEDRKFYINFIILDYLNNGFYAHGYFLDDRLKTPKVINVTLEYELGDYNLDYEIFSAYELVSLPRRSYNLI